ncbi:thioesterase family protein [Antrihabitans stalactiti]|uniref:Thioesterase n=1 Tax=Antrihabitans stalactiti TaxID=2584121 RepID=A0A848K557_9NOCA|nr:hotdog domain-containing protein [Antrihabitans stalactiti]NMN93731.1 thioesterase [Antrihabitans stalactiti]
MTLRPDLSAEFDVEVGDADTALALGSGNLEVLGTPRVVALMEQATVRAVAGDLPAGQTTVGVEVVVRHRRPSLLGARIRVVARLGEVADKRLRFDVAAYEGDALIADGTVRRVIVDREKFMNRSVIGGRTG